MEMQTLLLIHVALSFIAMTLGLVAVKAFFSPTPDSWTEWFLITALLTTITGFLFPISTITPAVGTGIFASLIFIIMFIARFIFKKSGFWRIVYVSGIVIQAYLLVFVAVAQAFLKIPELHALAPNGNEPAFGIAQLIVLIIFVRLGIKTVKRARLA